MSVTSSATVSRDREVQSPDSLQNRLLVVSITKRDGTPLDASSIMEEDIMELCVRRAHTRPLGVLWYSVADLVILSSNVTDVNCTQHVLLEVTEFCNEAVVTWIMALAQVHATAFIKMWHSNPTAGEGNCILLPIEHLITRRHWHHIHVQLGDLNDHELWQLVRDLLQEIVQCMKQWHPPAIPLLEIGHALWAVVPQRRMTRRSPFQEGEGSLQDHSHKHHILHRQELIWASS